ncbi:hypothetical protein CMI38_02230 [Candidatus Pacearchaeota archaeon]|nr:hypothetical protein [Candidatus Pacearchaeota archaeon]|tara:strand:+ start:463 stop:681 length:219 start_codon:yes stop_codon:yes gene_type:complete
MMKSKLVQAVLSFTPIPIVGEMAASRYIAGDQESLTEEEKKSDHIIRFSAARIAAYGGTGLAYALYQGLNSL